MERLDNVTLLLPNHGEPMLGETLARLWRELPHTKVWVSHDLAGRGSGWAIREGLKHVTTPWVILVMVDGSESPAAIHRMARLCTPYYDAVWGDRWTRGSTVEGYPWGKWIGNRLGNHLIARLLHSPYTDWTDLAKAFRTDVLRDIHWSDDFRCEIEIPIRYYRHFRTLRIAYVPMHWRERTVGQSSYRLSQLGQMLRTLVTVWREA